MPDDGQTQNLCGCGLRRFVQVLGKKHRTPQWNTSFPLENRFTSEIATEEQAIMSKSNHPKPHNFSSEKS